MLRLITDKQKKWLEHWFEESGTNPLDYGYMKDINELTLGEAGSIIGSATKEIEDQGFKTVNEYIKVQKIKKSKIKEEKHSKIPVVGRDNTSRIRDFRETWLKKGYELVNITSLCEPKLGRSGWCNDFNDPEEEIYHIQMHYRDEVIANLSPTGLTILDDDKYVGHIENEDDFTGSDFILFRKVRI